MGVPRALRTALTGSSADVVDVVDGVGLLVELGEGDDVEVVRGLVADSTMPVTLSTTPGPEVVEGAGCGVVPPPSESGVPESLEPDPEVPLVGDADGLAF